MTVARFAAQVQFDVEDEAFAAVEDCKFQRAHERVRSRIMSRAAYEKPVEMRPVRSVAQRSARPHGAGRAAARTRLVARTIESASDMPSIISGGRPSSRSTCFQGKLRVSPVLTNPLRMMLQDSVDTFDAATVDKWLSREQEQRELEAFQFLAAEEVTLLEKAEASKVCTSISAKQDVIAEDAVSLEFEYDDVKLRRAAARRETWRRKHLRYEQALDKKSLRNVRSLPLQDMPQPHGAGRVAIRTRLAHGALEAAADMPAIVQTGCGRKRKSRVSPVLKPSTAPVLTDVDAHSCMLDLPIQQALLEDEQQQRMLEASVALASHEAEVEVDREFAQFIAQPFAQLEAEAEDTQQLPSLLTSGMKPDVKTVAMKTGDNPDATTVCAWTSEQTHAEERQQLQQELQELQQQGMQECQEQEVQEQQQRQEQQEEYPHFVLMNGQIHAANEAINSMANEHEQLLVAARATKINAEVEAEAIKEAAMRARALTMARARAEADALKQAALAEAETQIRAMRLDAERELQAAKAHVQAQVLAAQAARVRTDSEELQDRFIARAAALLATKEVVATTLWDEEDWELVPAATASVSAFGNAQLFNMADPDEWQ